MQGVSQVGSCIVWTVSLAGQYVERHAPQCGYDVGGCVFVLQFAFMDSEQEQRDEAYQEESLYVFIGPDEGRPGLEVGLDYPEGVLGFPTVVIESQYLVRIIVQVSAYGVKAVIFLLVLNSIEIKRHDFEYGLFSVGRSISFRKKPFRGSLSLLSGTSLFRHYCGHVHLPLP